jgi:hypothetical protein
MIDSFAKFLILSFVSQLQNILILYLGLRFLSFNFLSVQLVIKLYLTANLTTIHNSLISFFFRTFLPFLLFQHFYISSHILSYLMHTIQFIINYEYFIYTIDFDRILSINPRSHLLQSIKLIIPNYRHLN